MPAMPAIFSIILDDRLSFLKHSVHYLPCASRQCYVRQVCLELTSHIFNDLMSNKICNVIQLNMVIQQLHLSSKIGSLSDT